MLWQSFYRNDPSAGKGIEIVSSSDKLVGELMSDT
jgi:hypothetical protein